MNAAPRRPFNHAAFLASYRARCVETGLDPATGNPTACADPRWWADPALWAECGRNHSSVERDALARIASEARWIVAHSIQRLPAPEFRELVREVLREERATLPLRDLHAARGVEVITLEGVRLEVFRRPAAKVAGEFGL